MKKKVLLEFGGVSGSNDPDKKIQNSYNTGNISFTTEDGIDSSKFGCHIAGVCAWNNRNSYTWL